MQSRRKQRQCVSSISKIARRSVNNASSGKCRIVGHVANIRLDLSSVANSATSSDKLRGVPNLDQPKNVGVSDSRSRPSTRSWTVATQWLELNAARMKLVDDDTVTTTTLSQSLTRASTETGLEGTTLTSLQSSCDKMLTANDADGCSRLKSKRHRLSPGRTSSDQVKRRYLRQPDSSKTCKQHG